MSTGAEGEESDAAAARDGARASAAEVTSFVERAKELSGRDLIRIEGRSESVVPPASRLKASHGMIAAVVGLVLGGGFIAGAQMIAGPSSAPVIAVAQSGPAPESTAQMLHRVEDQVHTLKVSLDAMRASADNSRQDEAIRGLKRGFDVLKQDLEAAKAGNAGVVAQLGGKIDKLDRDPTSKLVEISARLDRLEHADKIPNPRLNEIAARLDEMKPDATAAKLAEITARLERIEHSISSPTATSSMTPPPKPAGAASALVLASQELRPVAPAAVKTPTVEGWLLRDVYGGVALLEGRSGGLREVSPGQYVPGIGEIRAIERRGGGWVVITNRGIIEASNR